MPLLRHYFKGLKVSVILPQKVYGGYYNPFVLIAFYS
jgi:hypothetical protein